MISHVMAFYNQCNIMRGAIIMRYNIESDKFDNNYKYIPKTSNQRDYLWRLEDENINLVLGIGPAGTGKTVFPCQEAVRLLKNKKKIIITRPVQSVGEEIGYLPGGLNEKMDPWVKPLIDTFEEYYTPLQVETMIKEKRIEIVPLAFMRGRTFKNSFIIADEMQNSSPEQMKMLLTRLGSGSRMCLTGDLEQCDSNDSGLKDFITKLHRYYVLKKNKNMIRDGIALIQFDKKDVQRHPLISKLIDIYDNDTIKKCNQSCCNNSVCIDCCN